MKKLEENQDKYIQSLENSLKSLQNEVKELRDELAAQKKGKSSDETFENYDVTFHQINSNSEVLNELHKILIKKISIIESNIFFFDDHDRLLAVSDSDTSLSLKENVKYLEEEGIIDWINTLNEIKVIPNLNLDSSDYGSNFIIAPLMIRKKTIGIFIASTQMEQNDISDDILQFVKNVAENAALAMDNIRSKNQIRGMNTKLSNINKQMKRSANLLSLAELTNTITFEFSEPLKILEAHLYMLETGVGDSGRRIQVIREQTNKIKSVVGKIEEFNLSEEEKTQKEKHDINELLDDVFTLINSQMRRDGIKLENKIEIKPLLIDCYKSQIEQSIIDIILFQRENMPDGGNIQFFAKEKERRVTLIISDNGIGISEEEANVIFESTSEEVDLNKNKLFFVKRIVELHKGKITIASEEGKGITFKIIFPYLK